MIDREAVRSNAKYLRQVRPIDPEEISQYIDGQPHPAVVKQTLRDEAFDLGLVERADGTFVPVEDGPVDYRQWEPTAFPEPYSFALEDQLVRRYGANWHRGESGRELRERITQLKEDYFAGAPVEYDERAALGYGIYHLSDYYAAVGYVLETLTERGLLDRTLRVLDVGAGAGGPALGLHDFLFAEESDSEADDHAIDPEAALVEYHAVEPSASADVLEPMLAETARNFRSTIHRTTIEEYLAATDGKTEPFDLICFGNVLSELDDPVAVVDEAFDRLADDGTLLALEPADLETATGLRAVEREVAPPQGDVTIYAPTLRLWEGKAPGDQGWSFDVRPDIEVPAFQRRLDEGQSTDEGETEPGTFVNVDVQFAYSLLRTDGERRYPFRATRKRHAPMASMGDHVTERINLLAVKLSHNLSEGDNPLFLIGDGSQQVDQYAVLTKESALNRELAEAPYGAVLEFENVLALWNDDEAAYNLVVDAETVVDAVSGY